MHQVLPALIERLDDETAKVVGHAASAFVNFGEEVEKDDMMPYVDVLMVKLSRQLQFSPGQIVYVSLTGWKG
jgi:hypothetical protein